jgi:hypothetical protein
MRQFGEYALTVAAYGLLGFLTLLLLETVCGILFDYMVWNPLPLPPGLR